MLPEQSMSKQIDWGGGGGGSGGGAWYVARRNNSPGIAPRRHPRAPTSAKKTGFGSPLSFMVAVTFVHWQSPVSPWPVLLSEIHEKVPEVTGPVGMEKLIGREFFWSVPFSGRRP
jgi:hypothetical protein